MGRMPRKSVPDELRQALSYDPETGRFAWLINCGNKMQPGSIAGRVGVHGYREIGFTDKRGLFQQFRAHRLAFWLMTGEMPHEVDHLDRDPDNNRWVNLRAATHSHNTHNAGQRKDSTSGKRGVSWDAETRKWRVYINIDGRRTHLGRFPTKTAAIAARKAAELERLRTLSPS